MGILDFFKKKKDNKTEQLPDASKEDLKEIIDTEIERFFPETGAWTGRAYERGYDIAFYYFPCHLRDNNWLSEYLKKRIAYNQKVNVDVNDIFNYIQNDNKFNKKRHEYELRLVRWQICHMLRGGDGWVMPKGCSEVDLLISPKVDKIFREGIYLTLTSIGMDSEVVEEGIEKYADLWREGNMRAAFHHVYNPTKYKISDEQIEFVPNIEETHEQNWLKLRLYNYYQDHKEMVNKYGVVTPEMQMTEEEADKLSKIVDRQNKARLKALEQKENKQTNQTSEFEKI